MKTKNYFVLLMMLFVGGLTFSACSNDDDGYTYLPQSAVQFVNAYPYEEALGFKMDGYTVNRQGKVDYGMYLRYQPFGVGTGKFSAGISGTDESIVDSTITLKDSTSYTSIVYGTEEVATSILVEDKRPSDFDQGKAYVRFFNVADNTVAMDVNLINASQTTEVFTNRGYDNQTSATANQGFIAVSAGIYTIQFTDVNGTELAKRNETADLKQGGFYTIIARGIKDNTSTPLAVGLVSH
ncbi:DUF4397 domain-containing protein [Olivibacter sp. SA151]|uniref:DUF4397 domain-containing protein n=1 Tax=Sphingobacterium sp. (strain 21) TaxID=743722 RepID=F4CFH1_SPHS2